jgi:DNA-directed RNA polymerase specialized sigma24 family protein
METINYTLAKLKLGSGVREIATSIVSSYGLWHELDDIVQETHTRLLEDYNRYCGDDEYLDKMTSEQYYNAAIKAKVIKVCDLYSDPFTYYYQEDWVRDNAQRLLDCAQTESELVEIVDFKRAWATLTDKQRDAIERGERSGGNAQNGFNKLVRGMNKGKHVPYANVRELALQGRV